MFFNIKLVYFVVKVRGTWLSNSSAVSIDNSSHIIAKSYES